MCETKGISLKTNIKKEKKVEIHSELLPGTIYTAVSKNTEIANEFIKLKIGEVIENTFSNFRIESP